MDLYETVIHDVYRPAIEHYEEIFLGIRPNKKFDNFVKRE